MANWKYKIDISHMIQKHEDGECTVANIALELLSQLKKSPYADSDEIALALDRLQCLAEEYVDNDTSDAAEEFDDILFDLYDFGDDGHRLWIDTTIKDDWL